MKKKILCMLVVTLLTGIINPSNALAMTKTMSNEMKTKYSDDIIVTEENVLEILDDFGIEHSEIIYSPEKVISNYTVADLREALLAVQNEESKVRLVDSTVIEENSIHKEKLPIARASSASKAKKISETFSHDGYTLTHIVNVKYNNSYFTDVTSTDITLDSDLLPIVYKITEERNISAAFTKTKVTQTFDIDISSYVGVKYGLVKIGTSALKGNVYFNADKFL